MQTEVILAATPATLAHPWPVGAFFLTWATNEEGGREVHYQGRVLAFDGTIVWGDLYSWMDGGSTGVHAIAFDAEAISFYLSDREMRQASFEFNRYRHHYIGTFEENELWTSKPVAWTTPLPAGFGTLPLSRDGMNLFIEPVQVIGTRIVRLPRPAARDRPPGRTAIGGADG